MHTEEGRKWFLSDDAIDRIKKKSKQSNKDRWTQQMREEKSLQMQEVVKRNPQSYSANNVCGRTKLINTVDSLGKKTKLNGKWEYIVSEYFNSNDIRWTNKIDGIKYFWNKKYHLYFPDFYLIDYDYYIEVKGYEREKDKVKWNSVNNLIIIKKSEIDQIMVNKYDIKLMLEGSVSHLVS